ncbi:MAG: GDP-mannose 4,6-dehydratase [Candidatus Aenigmarchaeota archaeon]|nr:GDP-mannose 4,6-dehydratase [Candidatus Aenigmarchaeota archaeon]
MDWHDLLITPENFEAYVSRFSPPENVRDLAVRSFWEGKRVFITGISGFVGSHLTDKLLEYGAEVHGLVRRHSVATYPNLKDTIDRVSLIEGDLEDIDSLASALDAAEPQVIFHLGAQSFVPTSFRVPLSTYSSNIMGTANLLEAVRKAAYPVEAVHIAGSSEEYGQVDAANLPITEATPLRPMSPYALSKAATDLLGSLYHRVYGMPTVITRGFNHSGSRRGLQFVTSVIARQVARCLIKGGTTIAIGKKDSVRDFTHVADMVQGYLLAVEKGKRGEPYNLGHGYGITIENLAKVASAIYGVNPSIVIDSTRFRPAEVDILICDYAKAKRDLGYAPRLSLKTSIQDAVEHFRANPELVDIERH